MSPTYQTPRDLEREQAISDYLELAWRCRIQKMGGKYGRVDRRAWRNGQTVAVLELKYKDGDSRRLGCFYFDVDKANALTSTAKIFHCRGLFVVRFDDGVFYLDPNEVRDCRIVRAGRSDRDDIFDSDDAYVVPFDLVHQVSNPTDRALRDIGRAAFGIQYPEDLEELT